MKEKIVFFGAGPYVSAIIETLKSAFDIVLVVPSNVNFDDRLIDKLKNSKTKVAVLASFGQIVPDEVLNLFGHGIINIHPSLLPKYRGPTPVQTAILNGDAKVGVSIIKLDSEVDHGPILVQSEQKVESADTSESLYRRLFELGAELIVDNLPKYVSGELKLTEQNHSKATFTEHLTRESGLISIDKPPEKEKIERMIRAYYPWPGVWFKANLNGAEKLVKLLPGKKIQAEGKNPMPLADFANGYPEGEKILSQLSLS